MRERITRYIPASITTAYKSGRSRRVVLAAQGRWAKSRVCIESPEHAAYLGKHYRPLIPISHRPNPPNHPKSRTSPACPQNPKTAPMRCRPAKGDPATTFPSMPWTNAATDPKRTPTAVKPTMFNTKPTAGPTTGPRTGARIMVSELRRNRRSHIVDGLASEMG
jgi:hypothetical protein